MHSYYVTQNKNIQVWDKQKNYIVFSLIACFCLAGIIKVCWLCFQEENILGALPIGTRLWGAPRPSLLRSEPVPTHQGLLYSILNQSQPHRLSVPPLSLLSLPACLQEPKEDIMLEWGLISAEQRGSPLNPLATRKNRRPIRVSSCGHWAEQSRLLFLL